VFYLKIALSLRSGSVRRFAAPTLPGLRLSVLPGFGDFPSGSLCDGYHKCANVSEWNVRRVWDGSICLNNGIHFNSVGLGLSYSVRSAFHLGCPILPCNDAVHKVETVGCWCSENENIFLYCPQNRTIENQ
jgi:hypothetical protein